MPPELVFESVDGFGRDDARDPRDRIFLGNEHFVRSAFCGFACHPSSTLLVMWDGCRRCASGVVDGRNLVINLFIDFEVSHRFSS